MAYLEQLFEEIKKEVVIFHDRTVTVRSVSVDYNERTVVVCLHESRFDSVCMSYTDKYISERFEGFETKIRRTFEPECYGENAFFWLLEKLEGNREIFKNCFFNALFEQNGDQTVVTVAPGTVSLLGDFGFNARYNSLCIASFGRTFPLTLMERAEQAEQLVTAEPNDAPLI